MAGDFNQMTAIGRLTRDPELITFAGGAAVAQFSIAFTGSSRKNQQTGQWEDEPCFLDCKAFIGQDGKGLGDVVMRFLLKGHRVFVTGRLVLEQWEDKQTGQNRRAHRVVVERLTLLEPNPNAGQGGNRNQGGGGRGQSGGGYGGGQGGNRNQGAGRGGQSADNWGGGGFGDDGPASGTGNDGGFGDDAEIPF